MKKIINGFIILSVAVAFSACTNNKSSTSDSNSTMSTDSTTSGNMMADTAMQANNNTNMAADQKMAGTVDLSGASGGTNFAMEAANGNMMEIEMAKVAQKNAASKEVKDLAKMIMDDHMKGNMELKKIASSKNMALSANMPGEMQMHITEMSSKKGADFDKAYLTMMEEDHNKDIDMFKNASTMLSDPELKSFATKTLPVLQKHLDRVKAIQAKM